MFDSFDKESKLHESRVARANLMRIIEEAASGICMSSLYMEDGCTARTNSDASASGISDDDCDGLDSSSLATLEDVQQIVDGAFATDDDKDDDSRVWCCCWKRR